MPELPEVETICRQLKHRICGYKIKQAIINRSDLRQAIPSDLAEKLQGATILNVTRRAKYILLVLDNECVLVVHLGMSGQFNIHPADNHKKHNHVILNLDNNSCLIFNDPRRFGLVTIIEQSDTSIFAKLGVEPFSTDCTVEYLQPLLKKRHAAIKLVLMDNRIIVGVGNIYACESLFRAHISPQRPANKISKTELTLLLKEIRDTLSDAIKAGGSTLKDYTDSEGKTGYFQHSFQVYGRESKACVRCRNIIQRLTQGGRSSFFCPTCQR